MDANPKPKHVARIKKWVVAFCDTPPSYILMGEIYEHPNVPSGQFARTSRLLTIDFVNKIAETTHSFYKLEEENTTI